MNFKFLPHTHNILLTKFIRIITQIIHNKFTNSSSFTNYKIILSTINNKKIIQLINDAYSNTFGLSGCKI